MLKIVSEYNLEFMTTPFSGEGGKVVDYAIEYCDDFLAQQLAYGKAYATLPVK